LRHGSPHSQIPAVLVQPLDAVKTLLDGCPMVQDRKALLHKYLKPLRGKDRQLKALIDKTLYDKAFRRKAESLCNNAG
jgi:hypothetical protein